ncbi:MAG: CPBP family intramembrane metalloprotease [Chitinophagaceae bacterium]|nr:CPBP family intramembrane metalloprotease [Chitinophagaceae bacterium]
MALRNRQRHPLIKQGWIRALLLFAVFLVVAISVGLIFGLYAAVKPGSTGIGMNAMLTIATSSALSIVIVFLFRTYIDRRSFTSIGLSFAHFYPGGLIGFLSGLFLVCMGGLIIYLMGGLQWTDILFTNDIFSSMSIMLLVAFSEELVFRGYILRNLMKSFNPWLSLAISAFLFALVHIMNPGIPVVGVINIVLGGLVLGITFMNTRNLWMPVLFHFSWNFFQGPVLGFPVSGLAFRTILSTTLSGNDLITGGSFGFEGSVICTVLLLVAFLIFLFPKSWV